ncbi:MBL fold metallo-hydrolase [Microbacterium deminutum]|uniref:MBL fold metallo-hydrolase n=1 Tax=Microbacterium deminutum TaxID=344164 RepID=A0ABP5BYX5_9MICO
MRITRIGGPTALIEWEGWRILTDPTFDPPGRTYSFALGTSSRKTTGPAVSLDEVGDVDLVLLSHHQHADNLDDAGRTALERANTVVTTVAGAKSLGHRDIRGLRAGAATVVSGPARPTITVTATPCRHGPPLTRPIVGPAAGFALTRDGAARPGLWMTGDTVLHRGLLRAAEGLRPDVMVVHVGAVRFPRTGPLVYTMDAAAAVAVIDRASPGVVVPVHVEGWSHFSEQEQAAARVFDAAPPSVRDLIRWLPLGESVDLG